MGLHKAVVEEPPPLEEASDAFPPDDEVAPPVSLGRICLECGGDGHAHDGCAHPQIARLDGEPRHAAEVVRRLRRAVAEHRAATRALRALVLSEVARGRAELEPHPVAATPERHPAAPLACARCAEREAAPAAANAPRGARQKARPSGAQQAFTFADTHGRE